MPIASLETGTFILPDFTCLFRASVTSAFIVPTPYSALIIFISDEDNSRILRACQKTGGVLMTTKMTIPNAFGTASGFTWPWKGGNRLLPLSLMKEYLIRQFSDLVEHMILLRLSETLLVGADEALAKRTKADIERSLSATISEAKFLGFDMTRLSAERFKEQLSQILADDTLNAQINELDNRFKDEMDGLFFLYIPKNRIDWWREKNLFGDRTHSAFPSATFDIEEAAKCMAIGRHTACVLHLMRVLEVGLSSVCVSLRLPPGKTGWKSSIHKIEKEVKRRNELRRKPKGWSKMSTFYAQAAISFDHLKDAWRNHVAHAQERYDEERAEQIWDNAKALMQHLASKIKE